MLVYLLEHLLENYHGKETFLLNGKEFKLVLKDVALISEIKVVKTNIKPTEVNWRSGFRGFFFLKV